MRKVTISSILTLISLFTIAQNKVTFKADMDTTSQGQIKRLEYTLTSLLEKGEIDTYSGYLTEDYIRVNANGEVATKEQVLQSLRKGRGSAKMHPHDLQVHVYGNTAILHGILDLETRSGTTTTKRTSVITKVFIKRNGNWYMASMQGTAAKEQ